MFKNYHRKVEELQLRVSELEKKLLDQREDFSHQIKILKQQLASLVSGVAPSPKSILSSLPYSEIPKEQVVGFIKSIPNLLILDVRTDEGWSMGYIEGAKHIPAAQLFQRLNELADKSRPILTICANGNTAVGACQMLAREGYTQVFNALGGMAGYQGPLVKPEIQVTNVDEVKGSNRELIAKILYVIDSEIRPGLKRDGGDLKILEVENGTVKLKMVGACVGCGAQKLTVETGIKNHLIKYFPEIHSIENVSLA